MKSTPLILLGTALLAETCLAQTLEVELHGLAHARGTVRVGLYAEPKTFRKQALLGRERPAEAGTLRVVFEDLEPGRYALMAYHDEDDNGELNLRFGMFPSEGYGLSNNPKVMGPPAFEDSAFEVGGEEAVTRVEMEMRY